MKAKIVRNDGVVLELEGTPEEIAKLVPPYWNFNILPAPVVQPLPWCPNPYPVYGGNFTLNAGGPKGDGVQTSGYIAEVPDTYKAPC